jgi:methenyltetrahydrofolate cyclohydrolase
MGIYMDLNKSLRSYLEELSSNSPTPGGGNVSALAGSLACNLGIMVCNLTIGKKKYVEFEEEMKGIKSKLESLSGTFLELAVKDNYAFDKVMEAFKLPKETEDQKIVRADKIEEATFAAAVVPSEVIETARKVLPYIQKVAEKGNQNSVSDAGVSLSLLSAAAEGAYLNVVINCTSLTNKTVGREFMKKSEIIYEEVKNVSTSLITTIKSKLNNS